MRVIGKSSPSAERGDFIVRMTYNEIYHLCGMKIPGEGVEVDIKAVTDVVWRIVKSKETIAYHHAGLQGHLDAIAKAAGTITDAVTPDIQDSLRSEEGG